MWLKSIELKTIKGFKEQKILFHHKNKPYNWITLLGENGVGKSTLLQSIGLLLAGSDGAKKLISSPQSWVRNDAKFGELIVTIQKTNDDEGMMLNRGRNKWSYDYSYFITGNKTIKINGKDYPANTLNAEESDTLEWLRTNAFNLDSKGWFSVGYGAFRRLSRNLGNIPSIELKKANRETNFTTQFQEDQPLNTFEEWMIHLDYRIAKNPDDHNAKKMRDLGKEAIIKLLPGKVNIDQVRSDGIILFSLENVLVELPQLSDGFRSIIALAGDLIWRLIQSFPHLENPTLASGIVLIDELDIHLHPLWQRYIAQWLRSVFPNLQFIIATHSPLIVAGAGDDALTLSLKMVNGEVNIEQINDIYAYDFDYILTSPAFGLISTHSPATQQKIDRYDELNINTYNLTEKEKEEYEELAQFMREYKPIGGKPKPNSLEDKLDQLLELYK